MNHIRALKDLYRLRDRDLMTEEEVIAIANIAIDTINELAYASNYYEGKADGMEQIIKLMFSH